MDTIIITGGLGFIGVNLAQYFASQGYHVICVDNLSRPGPNYVQSLDQLPIRHFYMSDKSENLPDLSAFPFILQYMRKNFPTVEIYLEDIINAAAVKDIITSSNPQMIIHAAGQTSAIDSYYDPISDFSANSVGLINVLEAARHCKCLPIFLYLSTNKVYGTKINEALIRENVDRFELVSPAMGFSEIVGVDQTSHTPYGVSKLVGDFYTQEYAYAFGLPAGIFRMSCIYGPQQFGIEGQGWISYLIIQALKHQPITIFGSGKQVRDVLYISDLVNLVEKFFKKLQSTPNSHRKREAYLFNVGGGINNTLSLRELTYLIAQELQEPLHIEYEKSRLGDQKVFISDISKVSRVLLWKPKISPKEGVRQLIDWTRSHLNEFK
ncbi:MAG: NAD-dependent epimerase/dehydratase family protein [Promethearchaeota archaeon]